MSRRVATCRASWLAALALATAFGPAGAQEEVDSTRIRIRERLERLARPPGFDSVLYVQDSLRAAAALEGRRPGVGTAGDSVSAALFSMPGFSLTEYEAASATFEVEDRVLLLIAPEDGQATVRREGLVVAADSSILFDEVSGLLRTTGDMTFTPPEGDPVEAVTMIYDMNEARGSATGAKTSFREGGANWLVTGDMPFAAQDSTFMSRAHFTSCPIDEPHYHFEANQIKIVGGKVLVARGVRLYFADVPVFWLPFIAQSLAQGRSSGLLTPRFSVNDIIRTSGGYRRRVSNMGFYWAMSDYSDALLAVDWFSDTFLSLTSSVRYRFNRQFLDGSLNFRRYWKQDGSTDLAFNTQHQWEFDERTRMSISGSYTTSNDFVREHSYNPREVTQSIDSEGGINRRFGWGSLSLGANRKAFLSDDRTEWTLPSANLSLSTITLFRAPPNSSRFYNNMTWSGSSSFSRRTLERQRLPSDTFSFSQANTAKTTGSVTSRLSLGNLSISQNVRVREDATLGVPEALLLIGDSMAPMTVLTGDPARDISESDLSWRSSIDYQQKLVGSTTITPRMTLSGSMFRADTSLAAPSFVSAPSRITFAATLKTDLYGMGPGFGPFEAIRHKFSPSFDYAWSPSTTPTVLQKQVFRSRALQAKNAISITLNQTWEAKRRQEEGDSSVAAPTVGLDTLALTADDEGPRSADTNPPVTLLALRTSVVRYDFVEADSIGSFLSGFETTRLSNQISSDYLRGLSVSMDHDLFEDTQVEGELQRRFAPHLSQVNFSFSLGSSSLIFRWLSALTGVGTAATAEPAEEPDLVDPFTATGANDESSIVPGGGLNGRRAAPTEPRSRGSGGGWNARLAYSLNRPRGDGQSVSQMLTGSVTMRPTENWDLSWRTAYDMERGAFNDHTIRLSRDLHRWQANFDFLQTVTGNWSFRFEVSLLDNRDLKFDYKQRNLDSGRQRRF